MRVLLILLLGFLILFLPCHGTEITGKDNLVNMTVTGNDSSQSGGTGTPPMINPNQGNPKSIVDPSTFRSPDLGKVPSIPTNRSNNQTSDSGLIVETLNRYLSYQVNSSAEGKGDYYEWRAVHSTAGLSTKQTQSITQGDTKISSIVALYDNTVNEDASVDQSSVQVALVSRDHLQFSGLNYRGRQSFSNGKDFISNSFNTNRILKDSILYGSVFISQNDTDLVETKSTMYNLGVGFIGTSRFNFKFNNSEISEDYNGNIALNLKLNHQEGTNLTRYEDDWIPCLCFSGIDKGFDSSIASDLEDISKAN